MNESFSEGDWVAWTDEFKNRDHLNNLLSLVEKYGLGPFQITRVREHCDGASLTLLIGDQTMPFHASWFKKGNSAKLLICFPIGAFVKLNRYGHTHRNGETVEVKNHAPAMNGLGTAHKVSFLNGDLRWVYGQELTPLEEES